MQKASLNPTPDQTFEVVGEGAYNFVKVLARSREMQAAGDVREACNERFQAFDEVVNDISDKYPGRGILLLWSAYRRDGRLPEGELQHFRTRFAPWFAEFTADEHPADDTYLRDIEGEHPSSAAQARELWLRTENLWVLWPGFIDALRAAK